MDTATENSRLTIGGEPVSPATASPVAVIDIGASSIRMTIAEIGESGGVHTLDTLSRPVNLGKDTFSRRRIARSTIKECVRILANYGQLLEEYRIDDPARIRVVATTAVSEASNRDAFLDRIYIATGLRVTIVDEAELNRLTFLAVQPLLAADAELRDARALLVKIGGGSTATLLLEGGDVVHTHNFRQGTLRLQRTLELYQAPLFEVRDAMRGQIRRIVGQIRADLPSEGSLALLGLGRDVRLVASEVLPEWRGAGIGRLPVEALERFTEQTLPLSADELAVRYGLTFPEAETVTPALLIWVELARECGCERIHVVGATMRDGLLQEMALGGVWAEAFSRQIVRSALALGRRFRFLETHASHTAELATRLFRALEEEHGLQPRYESLLYLAALLHDIGYVVSGRAHHKHAQYLIWNSGLFGLGHEDLLTVALIARYHRRASPRAVHEGYAELDESRRLAVAKLAAILRVADALDRSNSQRVRDIDTAREGDRFVISVSGLEDLALEQLALRQKGRLFEDIYGMQVQLRPQGDAT